MAREMKDSGIEWIGRIPKNWIVCKIKNIIEQNKNGIKIGPFGSSLTNKTIDNGEYNVYAQANLIRGDFSFTKHTITEEVFNDLISYEVLPGDVCLSMMGTIGKCLQVPSNIKRGIMDSHLIKVRLNTLVNPQYFAYVYDKDNSGLCFIQMKMDRTGSIMDGLNTTIVKNLCFPLPPIHEQTQIVKYIDDKCAEIDKAIEATKASIEEYKKLRQAIITEAVTKGLDPNVEMKDSGVEWIGEIPSNWLVRPIKNSFLILSGSTPDSDKPEYWDGDIPWITPADFKTIDKFTSGGIRFITEAGYNSCSTNMIPKGSVIFSKRAPIGSVVINSVDLCTNQGCLSCIVNEKTSSTYFYYVMSAFDDVFNLYGSGTTFKEISATTFGNVVLPLPPLNEQELIASFLDTKCAEIDSLIKSKEKLIEELTAYRKSLIYEYVTGKKEVPSV